MLGWLAKAFEKICTVCVIINFIIGGIVGIVGGTIGGNGNAFTALLCFIGGLLIAFFINTMTFGFLAQIIEIRKKVDSIEYYNSRLVELFESDLINKLTEEEI